MKVPKRSSQKVGRNENLYVGYSKSKNVLSRNEGIFLARGWDFHDFLKNGIEIEVVKTCEDAMAKQVVEVVENGRKQ